MSLLNRLWRFIRIKRTPSIPHTPATTVNDTDRIHKPSQNGQSDNSLGKSSTDTGLAPETRRSFWGGLRQWWDSLWSKRPKESKKTESGDKPEAEKEEVKDNMYDNIFKENVAIHIETDMLLAPGLERYLNIRGTDFRLMGFNDGIKGIKNDSIENVAGAHASTLVENIRANSKGKLEAYHSEMEVKKSIMEDEEERYRDAQEHLDEMTHYYHKHPRGFSWMLFFFYMAIALFLIIADIPLAMILTEKGFNLVPNSAGSLLLTIGIALCAVYIKIYYDDFIATSVGHYINQFKKIPGIIGDKKQRRVAQKEAKGSSSASVKKDSSKDSKSKNQHEADESESAQDSSEGKLGSNRTKREINSSIVEHWIKFAVKTAILFLTLRTIWVLGKFRYQNIDDSERNLLMDFANWAHKNMGYDLKLTLQDTFNTTLTAFRLITIIFPVIGGICLSLALTNLQNLRRYRKAKKSYEFHQKSYLDALEKYNLVKKKYEDFKGIYDEWQDNEKDDYHIGYFTRVFTAYYNLGYQNGLVRPDFFDPNADFYTQMEKMRRRITDRKIYTLLQSPV